MGKAKNIFLILSWALYDLANQFFALNVVSLYFIRWVTLEKQVPEIYYGIAFGVSTFFVALLSPLWGEISDETQRRKPFLIWLTLLSIVFTMLLGVSDNIFLGLLFFIIANFGCQLATVFYNALMVNITPENKIGLVSGLGKMLSYAGAIIGIYLIQPIVLKHGYRATFLPSGLLFLVFALPCLVFVKDAPSVKAKINLLASLRRDKVSPVLKSLKNIAFDSLQYPGLSNFLKASFFGLTSVNAVILFMSVYATRVFGLNESQIINLIAFSTVFAIIGSLFSGFISDYLGHKKSLEMVFILWAVSLLWGSFVRDPRFYPFVGALVGISLGSTWVVSRSLAMSLVSKDKIGEVFGLFNLVGYLSSIAGALFWGLIVYLLYPFKELGYRVALSSLIFFLAIGFVFLLKVPEKRDLQ